MAAEPSSSEEKASVATKLFPAVIAMPDGSKRHLEVDKSTLELLKAEDKKTMKLLKGLFNHEPDLNNVPQELCSVESVEHGSPERFWTKPKVKILLDTYTSHRGHTSMWQKVSADVTEQFGVLVTAEKCRLKIRSLHLKYARQRQKNRRFGHGAVNIDEDLEATFCNDSISETLITPLKSGRCLKGIKRPLSDIDQDDQQERINPQYNGYQHEAMDHIPTRSWTQPTVKALLDAYVQHKTDTHMWSKVVASLNDACGVNYSAEKCRLKIRSLQDKYVRQQRNKNKLGRRRRHVDEDLVAAFHLDTVPTELATPLESGDTLNVIKRLLPESESDDEEEGVDVPGEGFQEAAAPATHRPRVKGSRAKRNGVDRLLTFKRHREVQVERRHNEMCGLLRELISALKDKTAPTESA